MVMGLLLVNIIYAMYLKNNLAASSNIDGNEKTNNDLINQRNK